MLSLPFGAVWIISIHALLAESDYRDCVRGLIWRISIHALLAESDAAVLGTVPDVAHFYPRSPCGERRRPDKLQLPQNHFYPRSPCGERPALSLPFGAVWIISIHALLAESDRPNHGKRNKKVKFLSTLSLRRATKAHPQSHFQLLFLSTLSLRRATT